MTFMISPPEAGGSLTSSSSSSESTDERIQNVDELLSIIEEVFDSADPTVAERQWVGRTVDLLDMALRSILKDSADVIALARARLEGEIESEERAATAKAESIDALRTDIRDARKLAELLQSLIQAPSQNEEHLLRQDVAKVRADVRARLELRKDASLFLPAGGPPEAEISGWNRVAERLVHHVEGEQTLLRECTRRLRSLRASNLTRSVLLDRALSADRSAMLLRESKTVTPVAQQMQPHANGKKKNPSPMSTSRPSDRPLTGSDAVLAALRSAGKAGATSQEILAYLQSIDHPIGRRAQPIKSVYLEIFGLRKRDRDLVRVARMGREARYTLGRSATCSVSGIHPTPSRSSVGRKEPPGARGSAKVSSSGRPTNEDAILSALRSFGSSGAKLNDLISVLKKAKHPLVTAADPRNAVYYQLSRIRERRPRVILCRKDGREVLYRMK